MAPNEWLTVKRKGRDDSAIARDSERAMDQRKQQRRQRPNRAKNNSTTKSSRSKKNIKHRKDSFIVNDSEESEEEEDDEDVYQSPSSEEEEEEEEEELAVEESSSEEESDLEETFFRQYTKPQDRNRKQTSTNYESSSSSDDSDLELVGLSTSSSRYFAKKKEPTVDTLQQLDDQKVPDKEGETPLVVRKRNESKASRKRVLESDDDDDDDDDETREKEANRQAVKTSASASNTLEDDFFVEDDDEAIALEWALSESLKGANNGSKKKKKDKKRRVEDDRHVKQKRNDPNHVSILEEAHLLDSDDESSSGDKMDTKRKKLSKWKSTGHSYKTKKEPETVMLLEDDDDEESNNDEEDDFFHEDEDARAAYSVLETANELSRQIMSAMGTWSNDASAGMIVDGAVALSMASDDDTKRSTDKNRHHWISHQEMKNVCPNVTLADYQLVGVNWLALLHGLQCRIEGSTKHVNVNGVLADEMGLGKTVQTITFLSWLKYKNQGKSNGGGTASDDPIEIDDKSSPKVGTQARLEQEVHEPHLVVAPASVLSNWEREFKSFAPHLNVVKYHGSQAERECIKQELELSLPGKQWMRKRLHAKPVDVILASVTYFQKEKSDDRSFLRKFKFDYLVVDEAHLLKNARGLRYKSLDRFTSHHRLLLTGTPVQNSPKELMSLLCFLMPLFSRKSDSSFDDSRENDGGEGMLEHFVSLEGAKGVSDEAEAYRKLKLLFAPFVLRRKKADVLSQIMPPKERKVEFVELDTRARSLYDSIIADHIRSKESGRDGTTQEHLFTQLRKTAHHPLLIRTRYKSDEEREHLTHYFHRYGAFKGDGCTKEKVAEEMVKYNDFEIHLLALDLIAENPARRPDLERYILQEEDLFRSAKFVRLRKMLPSLISDGHRILIFSVWTNCLDLLSCLLEQMDLKHLRMDGSTPVGERQSLIDKFNEDKSIPVFLLSTTACGLGINLTAADTCIMHDLHFNPFNDLQAEDRCHRIGQKKPVTVIKLVARETVDEDIYLMQERKSKMNAAIMETTNDKNRASREAAKEKEALLKTAVDRFLQSPSMNRNGKENDPAVLV